MFESGGQEAALLQKTQSAPVLSLGFGHSWLIDLRALTGASTWSDLFGRGQPVLTALRK